MEEEEISAVRYWGSCGWEARGKDRGQKLPLSYLAATEKLMAGSPRHLSMLQHES